MDDSALKEVENPVQVEEGMNDVNLTCKTSFGKKPELIRIIEKDKKFVVSFDNKEIAKNSYQCTKGDPESGGMLYVVNCTPHPDSKKSYFNLVRVSNFVEEVVNGTLIMKRNGEKMPLRCFDLRSAFN